MRHINESGLEIIKKFEGLRLTAYKCPAGIATIGWGHVQTVTEQDVINGKTITKEEAEELLKQDIKWAEEAVFKNVKVPTTDNQFSALVSWTFNLGETNLRQSTMLQRINANFLEVVPFEMNRWNKANGKIMEGLKRRRQAEGDLFSLGFTKKNL